MRRKLAAIISDLFDPRWEIPLLLTLAVIEAYRNGMEGVFLGMLLLVDVGLPAWFYWHLHKKHEISDWDITKRAERIPLYIFTVICHLGGVGLALVAGEMELFKTLLVFWLLAVMFALITKFWKVSVHAGVNAALATYLVTVEGGVWVWTYGLVVLVGWARVVLKKHQIAQAIIGGLLGTLGMISGMRVVGL